MTAFPSIAAPPALDKVFQRFPRSVLPLLEYHDRVLRDWSPLTVAERELIAAYVSGLNACTYCHGAHVVAARAFGIDGDIFEGLMADVATSAVDERLKPILAYVGKLTRTPAMMTEADALAVYAAGWDEQALFDAISVCGLFNLMNRIVEGSGIKSNPLEADAAEMEARMARMGGATEDPHVGEPSYSRLAVLWGTVNHGPEAEANVDKKVALTLNHVGIPARHPEALAAWYGRHFKLMVEGAFAYGDGWLIACEPGDPLTEVPAHFGFMLDDRPKVDRWRKYFEGQGVVVDAQRNGNAIFMTDPEGNSFEIFFDPTRFVAPQ